MKNKNNAIVRIICAIILGLVLVFWPSLTINYLVMTIGGVFLVAGVISFSTFLFRDKEKYVDIRFPFESSGSILFGLVLIIIPGVFINVLMYVMGVLLILACIQQIYILIAIRRRGTVPLGFYIVPVLTLICSLAIIIHPFGVLRNTFIFLGVIALIYGINELINYIKFRKLIG